MVANPLVSVIVTTKNEEANIGRLCSSIKRQVYPNIELIVVDNNSSDNTKTIAREYTNKVFDKGPERSTQRNYGVERSVGKYVLILDADMELSETVVDECVAAMNKNKRTKAVVIPEKTTGEGFWGKCKVLERNFYYIAGVNEIEAARFFDKSVFIEVGGYHVEIAGGGEDWDLPERIYKTYPCRHRINSFLIHHEGKIDLFRLLRKKYYYAKTAPIYIRNQRDLKTIGPKTVFFLRPVFYSQRTLWLNDPVTSLGTLFMLSCELVAGGIGFLIGKSISLHNQ